MSKHVKPSRTAISIRLSDEDKRRAQKVAMKDHRNLSQWSYLTLMAAVVAAEEAGDD